MSLISIIAAIDRTNGIGKNNQLLCHLPADLLYFKKNTINKPIIMGRLTYESIGKPLPQRVNIVISSTMNPKEGIIVVSSFEKALAITEEYPEVMIIGGAHLYQYSLPYAEKLYLTEIHHEFAADVFFPNLDESEWECTSSEFHARDEKNKYDMTFKIYEKKQA